MEDTLLVILPSDDDETHRLFFKEAFEELKRKITVQAVNDGMQLMS